MERSFMASEQAKSIYENISKYNYDNNFVLVVRKDTQTLETITDAEQLHFLKTGIQYEVIRFISAYSAEIVAYMEEDEIIEELELEDYTYEYENHPVAILNCAIVTSVGNFTLKDITLEEAKEIIEDKDVLSAVGHQSTADVLTSLLEREVPMNRITFKQEGGQSAIVLKLNGRIPEGRILSQQEIEEIGYSFQLLTMN